VHERERDDRHHEQHGNDPKDAPDQISAHGLLRSASVAWVRDVTRVGRPERPAHSLSVPSELTSHEASLSERRS
jgi:hypothetical protein